MPLRTKKQKSPPILSHEFVIQNHADIVGCIAVVFVAGMLFQVTTALAQPFVVLQYNNTWEGAEPESDVFPTVMYSVGPKDAMGVVFYTLIMIIVHQCIQEFILDKVNRRLHLSKVKHSKFNESGQQLAFCATSVVWASYIIYEFGYLTNISSLWEGYPGEGMRFWLKMFYMVQICYWIHIFPEFYFQKVKRDEMPARANYALLHLAFIVPAYVMNFHQFGLVLLNFHYVSEGLLHASRLLYFMDKKPAAAAGFGAWNLIFLAVRIISVIFSGIVFLYGLGRLPAEPFSMTTGNYNIQFVRTACLAAICLIQFYMLWNFCNFHLKRRREREGEATVRKQSAKKVRGSGDAQFSNGKKKN